jgi:phosphoribosyl-AMP cyclohydrolase
MRRHTWRVAAVAASPWPACCPGSTSGGRPRPSGARLLHRSRSPPRQNDRVPTPTTPDAVLDPAIAARLKRDSAGLVAAVVQQHDTGEVLMLGWMDDEALRRTLTSGRVTYWSRSRGEYWRKGDTSGHTQHVRSVALDCDGDALLVRVDQVGAACHTGDRTCFDADDLGAVVGKPEATA